MNIVYLEWLDARGIAGRVTSREAKAEGLLLVHTAGILINENEEVVRVSQDYWKYSDGDGTEPESYREVEIIARGSIQRRLEWTTYDDEPILLEMSSGTAPPQHSLPA